MSEWIFQEVTSQSPDEIKDQIIKLWDGLQAWAVGSRFKKTWGEEKYSVFCALKDNTVIGTAACIVSGRGQGILTEVWTDPGWRGKGIAKSLICLTLENARKIGAQVLYLAAWEDWTRAMYKKYGFVLAGTMGERHALKLVLTENGRDENLFRPGQSTIIRNMSIEDQGDLSALFNTRHETVVKHYELGCYLGSHFEGEFYILQNQIVPSLLEEERKPKKGYKAIVLDGEETILGLGTVIPSSRRHEGHTGILDILVHSNYSQKTDEMLQYLEDDCDLDLLYAYAEENEREKRELLSKHGWSELCTLPGQLSISGEKYDLVVYFRKFGKS